MKTLTFATGAPFDLPVSRAEDTRAGGENGFGGLDGYKAAHHRAGRSHNVAHATCTSRHHATGRSRGRPGHAAVYDGTW